jgi:hypothetical protein
VLRCRWRHRDICYSMLSKSPVQAATNVRMFPPARLTLSQLPPPRMTPRSRLTLDQLIEEVCSHRGISIEAVRSPAKHRHLVEARVAIAIRARNERIATVTEVARKLARSHTAIGQLLQRRSLDRM